jgi:hypothetical protein
VRIDLRDDQRQPIGRLTLEPGQRPVRATVPPAGREVFLNWDSALDDSEQLRRCVACGCPDLFREKAFPAVTAIVVVLAFIGAAAGLLGFVTTTEGFAALLLLLLIDVALLLFTKNRLVCYRCQSAYGDLSIARYHRGWDRTKADRYPAQSTASTDRAPSARVSGPSRAAVRRITSDVPPQTGT